MSRKVALLIGVSEYGEGIPSLSAPLNDVAAMERVLENPHMGGFDEVTTRFNPDLPAMQKAVQQIFANCGKDDLVLLFFSGHGITDDNNRLYLATKGTSKDFYKATSVPASFIQPTSISPTNEIHLKSPWKSDAIKKKNEYERLSSENERKIAQARSLFTPHSHEAAFHENG